MALSTLAKGHTNRFLRVFNLRLETLTAENLEAERLAGLAQSGHFARPAFPAVRLFESMGDAWILEAIYRYEGRFLDFEDASRNDVGYSFRNDYFGSPDTEVLYAIVREIRPSSVVEVGSGHSTRVIRQAIVDGHLDTRLISIDPQPRAGNTGLADTFYRMPVEALGNAELFRSLKAGDILFIDSSHVIKTGNDVVFLYLIALPLLAPGVLIHIHDIFLPYDYPKDWVVEKRWGWNEQYLVQALLTFSSAFKVLWAGYFLQRTRKDFSEHFPHMNGRAAGSLWLRKTS